MRFGSGRANLAAKRVGFGGFLPSFGGISSSHSKLWRVQHEGGAAEAATREEEGRAGDRRLRKWERSLMH